MSSCCVKWCGKNSRTSNYKKDGITFHRFPKNANTKSLWIEATKRNDWFPSQTSVICSRHFTIDCFLPLKNRRRLLEGAIPTMCLPRVIDDISKPDLYFVRNDDDSGRKKEPLVSSTGSVDVMTCTAEDVFKPSSCFIMNDDNSKPKKHTSASVYTGSAVATTSNQPDIVTNSKMESLNSSSTGYGVITTKQPDIFTHQASSSMQNMHQDANSSQDPALATPTAATATHLGQLTVGDSTPKSKKRSFTTALKYNTSPSLYDTPVKKRLCRQINEISAKLKVKTKKIKRLQDKNRYLKKRVASLCTILRDLEKQLLITSENKAILESVGVQNKEIIKRQILQHQKGHIIKKKYSPELRSFALTLHFYSAKAYDYVRKTFNTCLPSPKTLTKWYQCINGRPGFTEESLKALKMKATESGGELICTLVFDEIKLKNKIEYHPASQRTYGYVDFGAGLATDCNDECTEALVFLIVPINCRFKVPIGYFLTNGTKGEQKATLVKNALELCHDNNVTVKALTFDGCPGNLAMAKALGCNLSPDNLKTHFVHPSTQQKVFIYLDPVHMLKLVRNSFEFYKVFVDADGNQIKWYYIEKLNDLQETNSFYLANKLRSAHINFKTNVMSVKLATQLFSRSVAEALLFCNKELKISYFKNVEATARMIILLNDLFDILDSKVHGYGFKRAINEENHSKIFEKFDECKDFLMSLTTTAKSKNNTGQIRLIESPRFTGFLGFCIAMESTKGMYNDLVANNDCAMKYIPLHKISQDHIELFFCNVRSHGGCNDNPTPRLFESIYKKLLVHTELISASNGNCIPLENITILDCSSAINTINVRQNRFEENNNEIDESAIEERALELVQLSQFSESAIEYIAGFVSSVLKRKIKCLTCLKGLIADKDGYKNSLIHYKDKGGLTYPSSSVVKICRRCEIMIKTYDSNVVKRQNRFYYLVTKTMNSFVDEDLFKDISFHQLDCDTNHLYYLKKSVIERYINTRLAFLTKSRAKVREVRKVYKKLIHFKSQ